MSARLSMPRRWWPWRLPGRAGVGAIGLDFSNERLNLVQFSAAPDDAALSLRAAASRPYPLAREALLAQPAVLKRFVRETLEREGFQGRQVVACLHASELRFFPVSFAVAPGQDEAEALVADLRERLGAELEQAVVDYLPIRSEDASPVQRDALVVVAPRERVDNTLRTLDWIGLDTLALDVGPAAVARLVAHVNAADARSAHPNTLTINFGQQRSHLSVVWGRRLMLDRDIDFGLQTLLDRIARALSVDAPTATRLLMDKGLQAAPGAPRADAEFATALADVLRPDFAALVAEINKTLIYTASRSRGRSVEQLYLLGSVGRIPGAPALLGEQVALPVDVLDPLRVFPSTLPGETHGRLAPVAGLAVACGLALRGVHADA